MPLGLGYKIAESSLGYWVQYELELDQLNFSVVCGLADAGPIFCQRHLALPSPNRALIGVQRLPVLVGVIVQAGKL